MKILPTPYRPAFETLLKTNSTFTGPKLHSWIDSGIYLNSKFYLTQCFTQTGNVRNTNFLVQKLNTKQGPRILLEAVESFYPLHNNASKEHK